MLDTRRWLYQIGEKGDVLLSGGADANEILALCERHRDAIEFSISLSVTVAVLCLKTLNWFSMPEVSCSAVEHWDLRDVPAWGKLEAQLSNGTVH